MLTARQAGPDGCRQAYRNHALNVVTDMVFTSCRIPRRLYASVTTDWDRC
ncbi:hypothetical protein KCA24_23220 [Escherichia coli]|nr:hypothetical protein [Escherichia coli]